MRLARAMLNGWAYIVGWSLAKTVSVLAHLMLDPPRKGP